MGLVDLLGKLFTERASAQNIDELRLLDAAKHEAQIRALTEQFEAKERAFKAKILELEMELEKVKAVKEALEKECRIHREELEKKEAEIQQAVEKYNDVQERLWQIQRQHQRTQPPAADNFAGDF